MGEDRSLIFGKRLQELLESEDINQTELADRLNTTTSSTSLYVMGKSIPRLDVLCKICEIFDVTFDYLFGYSNSKKLIEITGVTQLPIIKEFKPKDINNFSESNVDRYLFVAKNRFENQQNLFGMIVKQQAMRPRFYEGDIVIIERTKSVKTGDIVMVTIGSDEVALRELVETTDGWVLNPFTPLTPPTFYTWDEIETKDIRLIGKVIESIVKF